MLASACRYVAATLGRRIGVSDGADSARSAGQCPGHVPRPRRRFWLRGCGDGRSAAWGWRRGASIPALLARNRFHLRRPTREGGPPAFGWRLVHHQGAGSDSNHCAPPAMPLAALRQKAPACARLRWSAGGWRWRGYVQQGGQRRWLERHAQQSGRRRWARRSSGSAGARLWVRRMRCACLCAVQQRQTPKVSAPVRYVGCSGWYHLECWRRKHVCTYTED